METRAAEVLAVAVGAHRPVDPPARRQPLRRPAADRRHRARRAVELQARHPRRADGRARRRADRAGAAAGPPAGRRRPRGRPGLAQHERRLRGRGLVNVLYLGQTAAQVRAKDTSRSEIIELITSGSAAGWRRGERAPRAAEGRRGCGDRRRGAAPAARTGAPPHEHAHRLPPAHREERPRSWPARSSSRRSARPSPTT